jgi:hypothetical protein
MAANAPALRFILVRRKQDFGCGILYNDGMVLALEFERGGETGLVTGAYLLNRGCTFTAVPADGNLPFPVSVAVQACTIIGPDGVVVPAIYYAGSYFFRSPVTNAATKRDASTLLAEGCIVASRRARGYAWG